MVLIKYNIIFDKKQIFLYFFEILIFMIIIDVTKEKNIETALKNYKNKVNRTKQIQKLKERKEYVKPSVIKREIILNAKFRNKIKNGL